MNQICIIWISFITFKKIVKEKGKLWSIMMEEWKDNDLLLKRLKYPKTSLHDATSFTRDDNDLVLHIMPPPSSPFRDDNDLVLHIMSLLSPSCDISDLVLYCNNPCILSQPQWPLPPPQQHLHFPHDASSPPFPSFLCTLPSMGFGFVEMGFWCGKGHLMWNNNVDYFWLMERPLQNPV